MLLGGMSNGAATSEKKIQHFGSILKNVQQKFTCMIQLFIRRYLAGEMKTCLH